MPKTLSGSTATSENLTERASEGSLSCVRRALEKYDKGNQKILVIRFSKVDDDEVSGFLKTRDRENEVFLTDFAAKTTSGGTIEYLKIGEKRIEIAGGTREL